MVEGAGLATAFGGVPPQAEKTDGEVMFYVYILESLTHDRHYVGYTEDVTARLRRHNNGKVKSTKAHRPWKLVYTETFMTKQDAYKRERQIKSYKGGEAFKKLLK